jgi:hypothetical protein
MPAVFDSNQQGRINTGPTPINRAGDALTTPLGYVGGSGGVMHGVNNGLADLRRSETLSDKPEQGVQSNRSKEK